MKKYLLHISFAVAFVALLLLSPIAGVEAQSGDGKVQEGLTAISDAFPDTVVDKDSTPQELAKRIIEYALYLSAILAVLFIIYGGYLYIFSAGSDDKAKEGRKTLTNALIGLTLIVLAYIIVQVVYRFLTDDVT